MSYTKKCFWENKNNTIDESKKYTSRTEFAKGSHGAYVVAKENNWLDEMTWLNRKNVYKDPVDNVYIYNFNELNSVYIGRTIYPDLRDKQHRIRENDTVYKFAKEHSIEIPPMQILECNLTVTEGAIKEKYWEEYYRNNGFITINKQPCGSLGLMAKGKWSKRKCFEEAKKYTKRSDFERGCSQAYHLSIKNGWIDEMEWMPKKEKHHKGYWNNVDNVIQESKKYTKLKDFQKYSSSAFNSARKFGIMDKLTWLEKETRLPHSYWKNKERVIDEAKKYKSKNEFQKHNQSAYWASLKYGYLQEMPWLSKNKVTERGLLKNKEYVIEESKKYNSRIDLIKNNRSIYEAAQRYGWIDEMTWLKKNESKPSGYWNDKERVIEESKKYTTRSEFRYESNGAYSSAHKHGWIDEMTWLKTKTTKGVKRKRNKTKSKEYVINESKKYQTRTDFKIGSEYAYDIARKNDWLDEMTWLDNNGDKHPKGYWKNKENIMNEAKKYKDKYEFKKNNLTAFLAAYRYGYIDDMDWLITQKQHKKGYWTYENIEKEALKYNTKTDFFKNNQTAYRQALKLGIIDDFFITNYIKY